MAIGTVTKTAFATHSTGDVVMEEHLTLLQQSIEKLDSYKTNVDNCGNCAQSNCCQSCQTTASVCQSCQTSKNCTYTCQSCQTTSCQMQCDCCSCSSGSCFLEDTVVLVVNDKKIFSKKITKIQVGEFVLGPNGTKNIVYAPYETTLGAQRNIFRFKDKSLYFSGEHLFWTNFNNREYWGVHDYNAFLVENFIEENGLTAHENKQYETYERLGLEPTFVSKGLVKNEPTILYGNKVKYATVYGWKNNVAVIDREHMYQDDTKIYSLILGGNHMFYANGYLVSGFVTDEDFNYENFKYEEYNIEIDASGGVNHG